MTNDYIILMMEAAADLPIALGICIAMFFFSCGVVWLLSKLAGPHPLDYQKWYERGRWHSLYEHEHSEETRAGLRRLPIPTQVHCPDCADHAFQPGEFSDRHICMSCGGIGLPPPQPKVVVFRNIKPGVKA